MSDALKIIDVTPTLVSVDDVLSAEDAAFLDLKAQQIQAVAASAVVEIGRHLIDAKKRVGHGHFLTWIERSFQWSRFTADNYINVAERFGNVERIQHLPVAQAAMYLLAGPSVPQTVRDEAVKQAEDGTRITKAEADRLIRENVQQAVVDYRRSQDDRVRRQIEDATRRLSGDNERLRKEIERIQDDHETPTTADICNAIQKSLGIKKMSPAQYKALAEAMGHTIVIGKSSYDPAPRERIIENEENLKVTSKVTEGLQVIAGAPPPESVFAASWPVQRTQHIRVIDQVIDWLIDYRRVLQEKAE